MIEQSLDGRRDLSWPFAHNCATHLCNHPHSTVSPIGRTKHNNYGMINELRKPDMKIVRVLDSCGAMQSSAGELAARNCSSSVTQRCDWNRHERNHTVDKSRSRRIGRMIGKSVNAESLLAENEKW